LPEDGKTEDRRQEFRSSGVQEFRSRESGVGSQGFKSQEPELRTPNSELRTPNPGIALVGGLPTRFSAERQFLRIANRTRVEISNQFVIMKVYIVEDAPQTRRDIANALAPVKDIEVVGEAESVRDAREGIYSASPEAVLLDISLPDGSGVEVLKLIRSWRKQIRVVVLTFDPSKELRAKCLELGAAAIFDKLNGLSKAVEFLQGLPPDPDVQTGKTSFLCN
jgi:CheY-like chemotaxis protein